jgi:hypothetical protein
MNGQRRFDPTAAQPAGSHPFNRDRSIEGSTPSFLKTSVTSITVHGPECGIVAYKTDVFFSGICYELVPSIYSLPLEGKGNGIRCTAALSSNGSFKRVISVFVETSGCWLDLLLRCELVSKWISRAIISFKKSARGQWPVCFWPIKCPLDARLR